ncbi:glycoside hydrolase family 15 protein [[Micrococcus luteus] ATCC 49442]|uniref:glycoside hydrolase family 15 protein n=1 Tax=[Micrococcus luteus] ATCC 49442 TaxID=2698727 RepID=UPI001FCA4D92|nr:glycoside hydrolase family 15 protein [[Micrococcus luteus] ATCC 49442]
MLNLTTDRRLGIEDSIAVIRSRMTEGEQAFIALSWGSLPPPRTWEEATAKHWQTTEFWRQWITAGEFPDHPWREELQRSALTLKGLTYAPTGALVAAPTTSLPETPGGERNWDYRYSWVRDSTFALWAVYGAWLHGQPITPGNGTQSRSVRPVLRQCEPRFLPANDHRVRATVLATGDVLTRNGLVLRYRPEQTDDGLTGAEGTFTLCSFWLVSALVEIGEVARVKTLCERLLSRASPLGLYAEELDPVSGRHLGDFPQAVTHLALIKELHSPRLSATCKPPQHVSHGADSFGRVRRAVPVYPAAVRNRPLDGRAAYAASGIASCRASTTSNCPLTETAT